MRFKCRVLVVHKDSVPNPADVKYLADVQAIVPGAVSAVRSARLFEVAVDVDGQDAVSEILTDICQSLLVNATYETCRVLDIVPDT